MVNKNLPFCCDVVFVNFLKSQFHLLSCGFMRLHYTSVLWLWYFVGRSKPCSSFLEAKLAWIFLLARHGRFHVHFQLSPCFLIRLFMFFVFWVNKINSSYSARVLKLRFFVRPFMLLSSLCCFAEVCAYFWPHVTRSCSR